MNRKSFIQSFQELNGSAKELTQAATTLCDFLGLHFDSDSMEAMEPGSEPESEGNERLLRHYVSVNIVDKPARQGREVRYGFRHLLQYATARRFLKQGFSLAKIAQYTSVLTTNDLLNALLSKSQQSEAELLVAAYKSTVKPPHASTTSSPGMSISEQMRIDPIHGMADLLKEIEQMRYRFSKEMDDMRRISYSLDSLNKIIDQSARHGLKAQNEFMDIVNQILKTVEETKCEVVERTAQVAQKVEVSQFEVAEKILRLKEYMERLIANQVSSEVKLQEVALKEKIKKEAEEEQSSAIKLMQEEMKDKPAKPTNLNGTTIKLEQLKREKDELEKKIIAESAELDKNLVSDRAKIEKKESIEGKNAIEILILKKNMQSLKEKNKRIEGRNKSLEEKIQIFREKNHILKQNMKRLGDKYIEKCKEN